MIRDLAPRIGRRFAFGVVPNWHGEWPLTAHADYCRMINDASEELVLHGYCHRRQRGFGPTTFLAEGCDEMNGLDRGETQQTINRGQRVFSEVFGQPAHGFLAPGWQLGHVRGIQDRLGLRHVVGFFSLASSDGRSIPLATWTWDCGRWGWLGHVGQGIGSMLHALDGRVPALAIHPRDLERGFWPRILELIDRLLESGYEPRTAASLLYTTRC